MLTSTALGGAFLLASVIPGSALAAGGVTHYVMAPSPIAPTASLAAGTTKTVTVSAEDSTNALVPGAIIYLSFSQTSSGGSASVGTTALSSTPVPFTATTGQVSLTYKTPAVLPMGGKDIVKAANSKSLATITASDVYSFAKVAKYAFTDPIAAPGTLAAGAAVAVTLTSLNSASVAVSGAVVYLSFVAATGGGTASVGATALSFAPVAFTSNVSGQIVITYHAPAILPTTGTDVITATDAAKNATITRSEGYSFGTPNSYAFSPSPIAATGTLTAGKTVSIQFSVLDSSGHPVSGATVWLNFTPTTKGGAASVGAKALSATPAKFVTDSTGTMTVTYKTSATPPLTGTDTIQAENSKSAPTVTAADAYTY